MLLTITIVGILHSLLWVVALAIYLAFGEDEDWLALASVFTFTVIGLLISSIAGVGVLIALLLAAPLAGITVVLLGSET